MTDVPTQPDARADWLLRVNTGATLVFGAVSLLTWAVAETLDLAYAILCGAVFVVGMALFLLGFWNGVQRSRAEAVTLAGLLGVSTGHVGSVERRRLWVANLGQVVIAIVFASLRPFSQQAFGLLVPMFGIGLAALWGSRFAVFFERDD